MSRYCQNCGRIHEGRLIETFRDGDNLPIEIVVCEHPRFIEEKNISTEHPDGYSTEWRKYEEKINV